MGSLIEGSMAMTAIVACLMMVYMSLRASELLAQALRTHVYDRDFAPVVKGTAYTLFAGKGERLPRL